VIVLRRNLFSTAHSAKQPLVKYFTIPPCSYLTAFAEFLTVRMMAASLFLPIALTLPACGPRVTNANIDALNREYEASERTGKSVTLKEVESILGQPTRTVSFPIEKPSIKELPGTRYYYEQDGKTVELHFIDGKLIRRVPHFGEMPSEFGEEPTRTMPKATP
jgi:hypothetical protein